MGEGRGDDEKDQLERTDDDGGGERRGRMKVSSTSIPPSPTSDHVCSARNDQGKKDGRRRTMMSDDSTRVCAGLKI